MSIKKISVYENGYEYEVNEEGKVKCPVCGMFTFDEPDDDDYCDNCGWVNTELCLTIPDFTSALHMSFEEAKKAYAEGREIK